MSARRTPVHPGVVEVVQKAHDQAVATAQVIKVAREAQQLSVRGLARLSGVSRYKVTRIEQGYAWAEPADVDALCVALGKNLYRLRFGREA